MTVKLKSNLYVRPVNFFPNFWHWQCPKCHSPSRVEHHNEWPFSELSHIATSFQAVCLVRYHSDVISTAWCLDSLATQLFIQHLVLAKIKASINYDTCCYMSAWTRCWINSSVASELRQHHVHHDKWFPLTNGQWCGKCFHVMSSSWLATTFMSMSIK